MKKSPKISLAILAATALLWIASLAVSLGDNLGPLAWPLYLGTIFCIAYFAAWPAFNYFKLSTPAVELPSDSGGEFEARNMDEYELVIRNMAKTFEDGESKEALAAIETKYDVIGSARKLVAHRLEAVDKAVAKAAFLVLAASTISRSSKVDGLCILFYNLKLIRDIEMLLGFRADKIRMLKLCASVFFASFVACNIDDLFESLMPEEVASGAAGGISSGLGGLSNAVLTMRIGYIAKLYVCSPEKFDGRGARRGAASFIRKNLPSLISEGKEALSMENLSKIFKKNVDGAVEK